MKISIFKLSFYICNFLTILIFSCNSNSKSSTLNKAELQNSFGSVGINFDSLETYNPFNLSENGSDAKQPDYTIISYINVECSVCIAEIDEWRELYQSSKMKNYQIKLVFYSTDKFEYIKYLCETNNIKKFPFKFYLDSKGLFTVKNPIFNKANVDKTILIDKNANIILTGNPLHSNNIKSEYLKTIM